MVSVLFLGWTSSYTYKNYFWCESHDPAKRILATLAQEMMALTMFQFQFGKFLEMGDPQSHGFQNQNGLILDDLGVPVF
jgi:phospholipase/lecithinase/hemolysin